MHERHYWVYIMASRSLTFYIGVTGNLQRRIRQHKTHSFDEFTAQYRIDRLVYFERFLYVINAIRREKQLKNWRRAKKIALINSMNPTWIDLAEDWGKPVQMQVPPLRAPDERERSGRDDKLC
jgi:putative endonuclease